MSTSSLVFAEPEPERCPPLELLGGLDHACGYRIEAAPGRPHEAELAAAAARARRRALDRLERRLGGFHVDLVQQNVDANVASVLQVDPAWLDALGGPQLVDRVLSWHDLPTPRLTFAGGGRSGHAPAPTGVVEPPVATASVTRVRVAPLAGRLREGYTAIVNQIDQYDEGLADLAEDLERAYGTRVTINCYVSHGPAEGFGSHWDDHDVIILQLAGSKLWELRGPDVLSPMPGYTPADVHGQQVWSGIVRPGTALYIPRGWGHTVNGFDELSIHLTVGMRRLSGHDVLSFVAAESLKRPAFRADVPYGATEATSPLALGPELARLASEDDIASATGYWRAQVLARPRGGFLTAAAAVLDADADATWIRTPLPTGVVFADLADGADHPGTFGLAANGVRVRLAETAAPALAVLADAESHRVADLPVGCDHPGPACRDGLVRGLLDCGIAHVVPAP